MTLAFHVLGDALIAAAAARYTEAIPLIINAVRPGTPANKILATSRAPAMPQLEETESSTSSLVDVDSPHVASVPSDYKEQAIKTDTQAERMEHEEEDRELQQQREQAEKEAKQKAEQAKKKAEEVKEKAAEKKDEAKDKAKKAGKTAKENSDNPVVIANAVTIVGIGALLSVGAYRKYTAGELTWKLVGAWAGVVGLFAAGDYYVSQYMFKKYPPKK